MITELQDKIAEYVNQNADLNDWKNIREYYAKYSYLTFAALIALKVIGPISLSEMCRFLIENGLEDNEKIAYLSATKDADLLVSEIMEVASGIEKQDVNTIYQGFLAHDYELMNGVFTFAGGKNSRDVLGSYYTQENFAKEISTKAIKDFFKSSNKKKIRIADYSCGGGAFLVSACKLCKELAYHQEIYGYDVDPIAVMITRYRLYMELGIEQNSAKIILGNPLLRENSGISELKRLQCAITGRFYNEQMAVFPEGNMDVILGNPPWEKIRFEEKKFLAHYSGKRAIGTKAERTAYLKFISEDNRKYYENFAKDYETAKNRMKKDVFFADSSCGELNTYALFTELSLKLLSRGGISGLIIKTSLLKMPVYSSFFGTMTKNKNIYEIYMFVNRRKIFPIDSREEFSVIYLGANQEADIGVALDLEEYESFSVQKKIQISHQMLNKLNPETGMLPSIRNGRELEFLIALYDKNQVFGKIYENCRFGRLVHLTNHSDSIVKKQEEGYLPIYEGKFIEIYTAKYATFGDMPDGEKYKNKASARAIENMDGREYPEARFFIDERVWKSLSKEFQEDYIVAWRSLTSATNRRTMLATALPFVPTCQSIQLLQLPRKQLMHVLAVFNSIVFDYIVRLKMAGLDLTQTIIKQIPVPEEDRYEASFVLNGVEATIEEHINSRIKLLYSSDYRMSSLFDGVVTYTLKPSSRKQVIAEIDRLVAILYGINKEDLKNIALSFHKFYDQKEIEEFF